MGIALDRYKAVSLSHIKGSVQIPALGIIFIIDITSILLIVPYSLHMKVNYQALFSLILVQISLQWESYTEYDICTEDWSGSFRITFGLLTMAIQLGLPFVYSLIVYVKILHTLKDRTRKGRPGSRLNTSVHLARRREQKARNRWARNIFRKQDFIQVVVKGSFKYNVITLGERVQEPKWTCNTIICFRQICFYVIWCPNWEKVHINCNSDINHFK